MHFIPVTHVIFDLDGLLLDSETIYDKIISGMVEVYDKTYTDELKMKVMGTREPETARILIEELELPLSVEEFLTVYKEKISQDLQNPALMPGAEKLVKHLSKHNISIAVATSSGHQAMELKTKHYPDLFKLFHHIVCGSTDPEVKNGKPAPDIFLVCALRFHDKPDPSQCLVFEDAPNGVKAAISAGMQAVMVPADYISEELKKPATVVLKSLAEVKLELFGLPPLD